MKVRDKVLTSALLLEAGVPTPRTFVTDAIEKLRPHARAMPLVVKPFRGRRGQCVEFVRGESEFDALVERRAAVAGEADEDAGGGQGRDGARRAARLRAGARGGRAVRL